MNKLEKLVKYIRNDPKPWWFSCQDWDGENPVHCSHGGRWYHEEYGR